MFTNYPSLMILSPDIAESYATIVILDWHTCVS